MSLNVGIIGFGEGGKSNFRGLVNAGAKVLAVSDVDRKNFKTEDYKDIDFYTDSEELIARKDIDLIVIATPDDKHFCDINLILKSGKYVFVEKPLVTSIEELSEIEKLIIQYPNKLLYSEKYSFSSVIESLLKEKKVLGDYLYGSTFYTMGTSEYIMGSGRWRTECAYNPCAGGLSHNFMVALLFSRSAIKRVRAIGRVLNYHNNLDKYGGFDFMEGTLEFESGSILNWIVDLSTVGNNSLFGHRTVSHFFQFKNASLAYSPVSGKDALIINGKLIDIKQEPLSNGWEAYNNHLYTKMYQDIIAAIEKNELSRHNVIQGINVAKTCILAYSSAKKGGEWINVN